jgi:hypothetical protein
MVVAVLHAAVINGSRVFASNNMLSLWSIFCGKSVRSLNESRWWVWETAARTITSPRIHEHPSPVAPTPWPPADRYAPTLAVATIPILLSQWIGGGVIDEFLADGGGDAIMRVLAWRWAHIAMWSPRLSVGHSNRHTPHFDKLSS